MTTDTHSKTLAPASLAMWWDGGERAITAREKATIEEHGPSCYTVPLVPAQAVDPADPWRGLYLPARMPTPSEYGDLTHPDIPLWPDDREDALDKLVHAQGFDFHIVAGDFTEAALEDGDELYWEEMRAWNPEAPEGEWRLAWKGDTEDGPYAWFVRPMALRPEPAALAAQPSPAGQGAVPCATSASHALRVAYRHLDMVSMRVSHCKDAAIIESAMKDVDTFDLNAAISALAARQPVAQVPYAWLIEWKNSVTALTKVASEAEAHSDYKNCTVVPVYTAPPAQGIDLHRLVPPEWLSEQLGGPFDDLTPGQAWRQGFNQCRARALLLVEQAMGFPAEQQCDAAPGVGNG